MWPRLLNTALGLWLMAARAVLGYGGPAAVNDRIAGPLIATFAVVAMAQATRPLRWVNTAVGAWLLLAPWLLGYRAAAPTLNDMVVGAAVLAASLVRGRVTDRFGGGWSMLWRRSAAPAERPQG